MLANKEQGNDLDKFLYTLNNLLKTEIFPCY